MWNEKLSHDYEGKRFAVDGDIIELYAYEYGACQTDVAEQFHAEPLEAYESEWLHDWIEHHDNMLRRTCDAIESENAKIKRAAERDADVLESLNLSLEESQTENAKLREELAKWERLAAGIDLPEYPVTQFEPKDLERENAKLRKMVEEMHPFAKAYMSIAVSLGCNDDKSFDWEMCMRELGIEVDDA